MKSISFVTFVVSFFASNVIAVRALLSAWNRTDPNAVFPFTESSSP